MATTFTFNNQSWTVPTDFEGNKYDPAFEEFLTDFVSHYGSGKHNFSATAAPTTGDDSGDGYDVGSFWFDRTNDNVYACVDATSTAAVWVQLNGGGSSTTVTTGITASTTQTQGQGALTSNINVIATCANDNDTVTLPTAAAGIWAMVINEGAEELQVFPASGDNLGEGSNTATVLKPGEKEIFWAVDATNWKRESQNFKIDSALGGSTVGHNLKNSDNGRLVLRLATDHQDRVILGRNGANDTTKSGIELRNDRIKFIGEGEVDLWELTRSGFNNPNIVHLWDEFNSTYNNASLGALGFERTSSGTGAASLTSNSNASVRKSNGDLEVKTGTTSSGYASARLGPTQFDTGSCEMDMRWHLVGVTNLATVSEDFKAFVGFANSSVWSSVTNAIGFLYDRASYGDKWVTVTMASGVATYGNTTDIDVELYDSSPYGANLRFVVNAAGTSVAFYDGITPLTAHATNIPNSGVSGIFRPEFQIQKTAGSADRKLYTSRFDLISRFTGRDPFVS